MSLIWIGVDRIKGDWQWQSMFSTKCHSTLRPEKSDPLDNV